MVDSNASSGAWRWIGVAVVVITVIWLIFWMSDDHTQDAMDDVILTDEENRAEIEAENEEADSEEADSEEADSEEPSGEATSN